MFDHVGFVVSDFEAAKSFYGTALARLGITLLTDFTYNENHHAGFGVDRPVFWIGTGKTVQTSLHLAFAATSHAQVDAFYAAAIAAGGRDNGGPGIRDLYHPNYYGAFILDADGNNIEAVCHAHE
ncbi:VOC family protein [Devosia algicola]|uniref:VOC family protein n=1 Tax=Devosia algicola TaxID=3026418 RepID=A0ABY7YSN3_9HYPH|nr:VOC family protein [Devosia algicola]WDR04383.1 VOC family protein [Devosia algicola]